MMEKYLIDTNTWIEYFRNRNGVPERIDAVSRHQLCVSEITIAELIYGAYNSKIFQKHYQEVTWLKNNVEIVPISDALDDYGEIRMTVKQNGTPVRDQFDLLIGATARHNGFTVVTENLKDFLPIPDIKVVNWTERKNK